MSILDITTASVSLPRRRIDSHKGDHGRLLIVGGSVGCSGAPNLAARAAVRAGAGLTYLGVPEPIWPICAVKNDEAMPFPLPADTEGRLSFAALEPITERLGVCDTLLLGPGLGRSDGIRALVQALVRGSGRPMLLDADALRAVGEDTALLKSAKAPIVLTPHEGEFLRLGGILTGDRAADAARYAEKSGCTVVLKGHHTVIAFPDGRIFRLSAGNPGMAKGGSGDVLAGVIAALLGQLPWEKAIVTGTYLHSAAGDLCAARLGEYGMNPTDLIEALPEAEREIIES